MSEVGEEWSLLSHRAHPLPERKTTMFQLTPITVSRYLRRLRTVEACNRSIARLTRVMAHPSSDVSVSRLLALQTAVAAKRTTLELVSLGRPESQCGKSIGRMVDFARAAWS